MVNSKWKAMQTALVPERIRAINSGSFGFIPHRFLADGFFSSLSFDELALYLFLLLAANRTGVSFYGYEAICSILGVPLERYIHARNNLIKKDLIAFDGTRFQVLSLPETPVVIKQNQLTTQADFENHDPATIRNILLEDFGYKTK